MGGEKGVVKDQASDERKDTCRIDYVIHFLLGAGNLLPWNAFITAVDHFAYWYPTNHIEKVFSVAYMSSSVLALVRVLRWGGWCKNMSYRLRMNLGFSMFVLSLMVRLYWYPILMITVYNVADFIGKSLTAIYVLKSIKKVVVSCMLRLLFYPLFMACLHGPKWLKTETPVIILTFMLRITNGYLTSVLMILVSKSVPVSEASI